MRHKAVIARSESPVHISDSLNRDEAIPAFTYRGTRILSARDPPFSLTGITMRHKAVIARSEPPVHISDSPNRNEATPSSTCRDLEYFPTPRP